MFQCMLIYDVPTFCSDMCINICCMVYHVYRIIIHMYYENVLWNGIRIWIKYVRVHGVAESIVQHMNTNLGLSTTDHYDSGIDVQHVTWRDQLINGRHFVANLTLTTLKYFYLNYGD